MSPTSLKNKDVIKELEKTISPILVVNNSSLKPYVELFEYEPENIYQQPLGSLVGFFEVKEFSEDSAYIVNFLTSVLKKEYYINPKRPVTESLDSALHKVNMALSELAKHGNVEWLGKLNAAICVLEKNNAHFSVSGGAKIFLYRKQGLSEISEDLASESLEPHPLKTFVNVSSGRLENEDRLLITSEDIFHILTAVEIKKNLQRFEGDKFVQFLKTALSNQLEMIVSIVVEMKEVVPVPVAKTANRKKSARAANAFSEQTFANTPSSNTFAEKQSLAMPNEIELEPEYTDEKTGHIYVQGDVSENSETANAQISLYWDMVKEKVSQGTYLTKNEIRKRYSLYKKQLAKKRELRKIEKERLQQIAAEENKRLEEERVLLEIEREQKLAEENEKQRIVQLEESELQRVQLEQENERRQAALEQEKIEREAQELRDLARAKAEKEALLSKTIVLKKKSPIAPAKPTIKQEQASVVQTPSSPQSNFLEKLRLARLEQQGNAVIDLSLKTSAIEKTVTPIATIKEQPTALTADTNENRSEKIFALLRNYSQQALLFSKKAFVLTESLLRAIATKFQSKGATRPSNINILPHFSKIRTLFSRFSAKQKLYTVGALALVFIAPLFIVHYLNKPKTPVAVQTQTAPPNQAELLSKEKNINVSAQAQKIFTSSDIIATLLANGNPTIITKSSVIVLQGGQPKEFALPADSGTPIRATYMQDLSLILIITNSKIISFSPISTKFTDNNINLESISKDSFVGTYLTYLYMLDQKSNQVYRFPRADGGFGEATNWLKDKTSLDGVSDMTIDDNIYAIQNNQVLKFFKGQKQTFSLEASSTPVHFDKLYTNPDLQALYALDTQNSRLVAFSKDGSILAQYYNEALKDGISLTVDEQNKVAYISTSLELISLSIQ